jgi:hypothetical protein
MPKQVKTPNILPGMWHRPWLYVDVDGRAWLWIATGGWSIDAQDIRKFFRGDKEIPQGWVEAPVMLSMILEGDIPVEFLKELECPNK